ncbi:MAG: hypothetical protein H6741_09355 [Alphaproteobacteria bacterium]|nr:hypothetical protein [Alphaproteobacteria bacterium]
MQRLVDARVSGVLFTIDPVSGSWREMCLEAAWGQGEALVSGRVLPDRYRLRRPRRQLRGARRVLARLRLEVLAEDRVSQVQRLVPGGAGELDWEPVEQPEARKLDAAGLLRVGRMGLRAEALGRRPRTWSGRWTTRGGSSCCRPGPSRRRGPTRAARCSGRGASWGALAGAGHAHGLVHRRRAHRVVHRLPRGQPRPARGRAGDAPGEGAALRERQRIPAPGLQAAGPAAAELHDGLPAARRRSIAGPGASPTAGPGRVPLHPP